jgi:antitoxin ParD1/3/4
MDRNTVNVDLPERLRSFVDERLRQGDYANENEYFRDLVRRDREEQAARRLRELIEEGLRSGPPREMSEADWVELRRVALRQAA